MNLLLISTYDSGHQPFSLASMAAWLRNDGHSVRMADVSLDSVPLKEVRDADAIGISLPMHTATRLVAQAVERVRSANAAARLFAFGLYAPLNAEYLQSIGFEAAFGGEFEQAVSNFLRSGLQGPLVSLDRLKFLVPDRTGLPALRRYAKLRLGASARVVGYTEASRGCKHLCRHCPVVPVYGGAFRIVQPDVVLQDIRCQIAAGAEHITFGDPDFFNGPTHAVRIVQALHSEFPGITFDATIKIEHLLKHRRLLPLLRDCACLFVTSAVESVDDYVLGQLNKGHTRAEFEAAANLFEELGMILSPTFIPFTPWTTREGYLELLRTIVRLGLVEQVSPVQLTLRLLLPQGSQLLALPDISRVIHGFDQSALLYRWSHADPAIDELARQTVRLVHDLQKQRRSRSEIFEQLWALATNEQLPVDYGLMPRATVPYLDEPWYC